VVLPFWTSFLVRTFAMIFLLRDSGLVNTVLLRLGLIDAPLTLLYTPFAVLLGLVYGFLPFMILPIYASLEKLDPTLLEAAETLGATPLAGFRRITLPAIRWAVAYGVVLTTARCIGEFGAVSIVSGRIEGKTETLPIYVQSQYAFDFNTSGAYAASVVLALIAIATVVLLRVFQPKEHH